MKNNIPTEFVQRMTTIANNTEGMLSKFPFNKPGIMFVLMTCSTPNDILMSRHQGANNANASTLLSQMIKNQTMTFGSTSKNITASR
jgi:hypothetical protein